MALLDDNGKHPPAAAPPAKSALRSVLPYTTVLLILIAIYVAWTMWSRHQSNVDATRRAQQKAAEAEQERNDQITQHGELTFTTFYAENAEVKRGQSTRMCYGVINAKTVKLDPPVEAARPTERHCIDITPAKTTTYTISATGDHGETKSLSITVRVK